MSQIYSKLFNTLEIGDHYPTTIMGVLNLSPESFFKGSIITDLNALEEKSIEMINNGAKILDLGARSTAPWSEKINIETEIERLVPAMELLCAKIPENVIISVDTQYKEVAKQAHNIALRFRKKMILNDVSCLKTDPSLEEFIVNKKIPLILMASRKIPGDLLTIDEIIEVLQMTIKRLISKGVQDNNVIIDPGIGHWIEQKTYEYDLKIINDLYKLKVLKKPILVSLSRKSFIGTILNADPENRYNGSLSATAIAVYNGAHIVRTHDVNQQLVDIIKVAENLRKNK
jgi:dihydropteroate synthase